MASQTGDAAGEKIGIEKRMCVGCCLVFSFLRVKCVTICPGRSLQGFVPGEVCNDLSRVKSVAICPG